MSPIESRIESLHAGERVLSPRRLTGGISATMTAYEVEAADGRRRKLIARQLGKYRMSQRPRATEEEFRVLTALHRAGLPVQTPVAFVEDEPPFYVVEFIEGAVDVAPRDPSRFVERYAQELSDIHSVDWQALGLDFLPRQDRGFGPRRENPNESLRGSEVRDALEAHGVRASNEPVLRHGDFWPGNVLWRDGEISGVIDWEESLIGEPLADLGICRLDLWWIMGEEAAYEFTERYFALRSVDARDLAYWDLCASLRPMPNMQDWCGSYPELGRPDITESTMRRDHQAFVEQALSRLD